MFAPAGRLYKSPPPRGLLPGPRAGNFLQLRAGALAVSEDGEMFSVRLKERQTFAAYVWRFFLACLQLRKSANDDFLEPIEAMA